MGYTNHLTINGKNSLFLGYNVLISLLMGANTLYFQQMTKRINGIHFIRLKY